MKIFEPLTRQPLPSRVALVARSVTAEPASGSVMPTAMTASPARRLFEKDCFWKASRTRPGRGSGRSCPPARRRRCAGRPRRPPRWRAPRPSASRPGRRRLLGDGDAEQALLGHLLRHIPRVLRRRGSCTNAPPSSFSRTEQVATAAAPGAGEIHRHSLVSDQARHDGDYLLARGDDGGLISAPPGSLPRSDSTSAATASSPAPRRRRAGQVVFSTAGPFTRSIIAIASSSAYRREREGDVLVELGERAAGADQTPAGRRQLVVPVADRSLRRGLSPCAAPARALTARFAPKLPGRNVERNATASLRLVHRRRSQPP